MENRSKRIIYLGIATASIVVLGIVYWYWYPYRSSEFAAITPYRASDRASLTQMLNDDWYWLVAENATDFSADYMFDHQAANYHYPDKSLSISVYREADGRPAGFVTFHRLDGTHGRVQFLAVAAPYRRKGYAKKLLAHAVQELRKEGLCFIELAVRRSNTRARALYQSLGFKETWQTDDGFSGYSLVTCPAQTLLQQPG